MPTPSDPAALFAKASDGDRRALARLFTRIERNPEALRDVMRLARAHSARASVIGVTGPPGAGKSTLVDAMTARLRAQGKTVGILAVDPTSPFTGGAVLGDRIRMQSHHQDSGVFIRSVATRGAQGGLASVARAAITLLDAAGKDVILVETVGVGQSELDITAVADLVIVVLVPEAGDAVQTLKAGLLEIADVFVVNKADRDGAGQMASAIRATVALDPRPAAAKPRVLLAEAQTGEGVPALLDEAQSRLDSMRADGRLADRRALQASRQVARLLSVAADAAIERATSDDGPAAPVLARLRSGDLDAYAAAAAILDTGVLAAALNAPPRAAGDSSSTSISTARVIGIDLTSSESKPTACAVLDSNGAFLSVVKKTSDADIVNFARECAPVVVAIDSPLGFPKGMDCLEESHACRSVHPFKGRLCERDLVNMGISLYITTKRSIIKSMIYRAIALADKLRALGVEVIEVYPHASKVFLFGNPIPKKTTREGKDFMTRKLNALIPRLSATDQDLDHDDHDALVAAHTAYLHTRGNARAFGIQEEAQIYTPANPAASDA